MIDWARVTELRSEIGPSEFEAVVDLFLEEVEALLARLREKPSPDLYEEDLHFLKGCAANLGFRDLARLCLKSERLAVEGRAEEVDLQPIFENYENSRTAFLDGVAGLAAEDSTVRRA
ncbi:Hpt domain-containing protein [Tropicimonas isoalkanivorans]|uniref:Hpt domain-containing protein n=1 Tax=Tropicimonas isoalkanivorans TaxID=441112 RepID=A0A1I1M456_9RHOB|nr:Hpt domain-containing protein [Tropicimonas isoalkanivorans]SFC77988.1 Hpt domain-containing protein [Tropicimonas isoalkanivorans]